MEVILLAVRKTEKELLAIACKIFVETFTKKKPSFKPIDYAFEYPPQILVRKRGKKQPILNSKHKRRKQTNWQEWNGDSTEPILGY